MRNAELRIVSPTGLGELVPSRTALLTSWGAGLARDDGMQAWAMHRSFLDPEAGRSDNNAHASDCACCGVARALDASLGAIFAAQVRGQVIATVAVVVPAEDVARIRKLCAASATVAARFHIS